MAHPVQAFYCCVWSAMFNELLNSNGKIAIGLIGIRTGAGPIFTFVNLKPFRCATPCFLGKWQTSKELSHLLWRPIRFIDVVAPLPAFKVVTPPDKAAHQRFALVVR